MTDPEFYVRREVAKGLAQFPSTTTAAALIDAWGNPQNGNSFAYDTLVQFEDRIVIPHLLERLKDAEPPSGIIAEAGRRKVRQAEPRLLQLLSSNDGSVNFFACSALRQIRNVHLYRDVPEIKRIFDKMLNNPITKKGFRDKFFSFCLKESYGGGSVQQEGDYQVIHKGLNSPNSIIFLERSEWNDRFFGNIELKKRPSANWEKDLQQFTGLSSALIALLHKESKWDSWESGQLEELWLIQNDPKILSLTIQIQKKQGAPDPNSNYRSAPKMQIFCVTLIAQQLKPEWHLTVVRTGFGDNMFGVNDTGEVWDIVDLDEDGKSEIIFQIHGYESHELNVYAIQPDGSFKSVFKGGGYSL